MSGDLEAFNVRVIDHRELDKLRDLRALVLRLHALISEGTRGPVRIDEWLEVVNAARAAMTPGTFDPATGLDGTAFTWSAPPRVVEASGFDLARSNEVMRRGELVEHGVARFQLHSVGPRVNNSRVNKLATRARSDRRGLDVVEIEATCQHELIKCNPGRYKIDSDGWLVDTKGGRK